MRYLNAERAQTDADLRQVESTFLMHGLGRERGSVRYAVFLYELGEHGDPLTLSHHTHRLNLRNLKRLVTPVYLSWHQLVDQPAHVTTNLHN